VRTRAIVVILVFSAAVALSPGQAYAGRGTSSVLHGFGSVSPTNIWAAGYSATRGVASGMLQHWDGTTWSIVASPNPGPEAPS
jgi:hypothetical protein